MAREREERISDVRRLLAASRHVHAQRARLLPDLVETTGLSAGGVELGFESLEREATDRELGSLVDAAGDARHVHLILSANVFVAPMRAISLARAAAERVTVRASSRDPVLARALIEAADDSALSLVGERDVARTEADVIHVYGRDETVLAVSARARQGAIIVGHGAGLGVAVISPSADAGAVARDLATDVVAFDQRGCLSPRVVVVVGHPSGALAIAEALDGALAALGRRIPRGALTAEESREAVRWSETMAFAGRLWRGTAHVVALDLGPSIALPPPGRHVLVVSAADAPSAVARLEPLRSAVVAVGSDEPEWAQLVAPAHARMARLGTMQRPPLDGPVDRRVVPRIAVGR